MGNFHTYKKNVALTYRYNLHTPTPRCLCKFTTSLLRPTQQRLRLKMASPVLHLAARGSSRPAPINWRLQRTSQPVSPLTSELRAAGGPGGLQGVTPDLSANRFKSMGGGGDGGSSIFGVPRCWWCLPPLLMCLPG